MSSNEDRTLDELRTDLETEDQAALKRWKIGIAIRAVLIVLAVGYMSWISGSISKLDAGELTRIASANVQEKIPEWRTELHQYAVGLAPDATDHVRDLFVSLPATTREYLEAELVVKADELIARFESDIDDAISTVIADQIAILEAEFPDATPEEQLDRIVLGVSAMFHDTMIEAIDELHEHYAAGVQDLNAHLNHLLTHDDLTEGERIDKELIEAWMVLVHHHGVTHSERLIAGLERDF